MLILVQSRTCIPSLLGHGSQYADVRAIIFIFLISSVTVGLILIILSIHRMWFATKP